MKGRFSGRKATQMFMHLPHFSRCEHTPREFDTSGVGL
jgi:hypothetical protein